jgi:tetratricopeptide (TPR) repeat protein
MAEGQLIFRDDASIQILNAVYLDLKDGAFAEAIGLLETLLERDMSYPGAASALKCAAFWREREEAGRRPAEGFQRGEWFLAQWRLFQAFAERLGDAPERCMFAIKRFVFSSALDSYLAAAGPDGGSDPDVLLQLGRCCKGIGNYERAIDCLERANQERRDSAAILAELADCYSLVNETRAAKVFFREAFFIDPQAVDLDQLESPIVTRLAARVREKGFGGPELAEWIPVYGAIWGVFSVKREMKPLELGKLKQSIFQLEKERGGQRRLLPRLLTRYFWLIDHYLTAGEPRERIDEVLERIRELDPRVHAEYTG